MNTIQQNVKPAIRFSMPSRRAFGFWLLTIWHCGPAIGQIPILSGIRPESNGFVMAWQTVPGSRYALEAATNITVTNWESFPIESPFNLVTARGTFGAGQLFYQMFQLDAAPPRDWALSPSERAIAVSTNGPLSAPLFDDLVISTNTIRLAVAGRPAVGLNDPRLVFADGVLTYKPAPGEVLGNYRETVAATLAVADSASNLLNLGWSFELEPPPSGSTNVIVASEGPAGLELVAALNGTTFTYAYSGDVPMLTTNTILVGTNLDGSLYRRRVVATNLLAGGQIEVQTTDASLADCLAEAGVQFDEEFLGVSLGGAGQGLRPAALPGACCTADLGGLTLLSNANFQAGIPSGRLRFAPRISVRGKFGAQGLQSMDVVMGGQLGLDFAFRANARAPGAYTNSISLGSAQKPFLLERVAAVPVWGEAKLEMSLGFESNWRGTGSVSAGISMTNRIAVESRLRGGVWSNSASRILTARVPVPGWTTNLEADTRAFVDLTLTLHLDDEPGPSLRVRDSLEANGVPFSPPGSAGYDVFLREGLTVSLALDARGWDSNAPVQTATEVLRARTPVLHTNQLVRLGAAPAAATGMVWIPPGRFAMGRGSPAVPPPVCDCPLTQVTITEGFYLGRREVTQREYLDVTGSNPSFFNGGVWGASLDRPVENVSWFAATNYCAQLTVRERLAGRLPSDYFFRLPTEAEWEYACRAGTTTRYHYGDELRPGMANFNCALDPAPCLTNLVWELLAPTNSHAAQTVAGGSFAPNLWGAQDMHGNVSEWCQDWLGNGLPGGVVTNVLGAADAPVRGVRGGSFTNAGAECASSSRVGLAPNLARPGVGFRVVLARLHVATESYSLLLPRGFSLIANQLDNGGNTLAEVLPNVPNGTFLYKLDASIQAYVTNEFQNGWLNPMTLAPGEGAFISLPTNGPAMVLLTFTGVRRESELPPALVRGLQFVSRQIPKPGYYQSIVRVAPADLTQVYRWTPDHGYDTYTYFIFGGWDPEDPVARVGEAWLLRIP